MAGRSRTSWLKRGLKLPPVRVIVIAVATLVFAAASGAFAVARIVADARPDFALSIMPSLPPALAAKADGLIADSNGGRDRAKISEARHLAQRSLRATALNPEALRTLAVTGPQRQENWEQLIEVALRVSRRDIGSQLMAIELQVARNNIQGALRHYDQALRVRPSVGATLYPVLLAATDADDVRLEVRRLVATDPIWLPGLVIWSLENPDQLAKLARLVGVFPAGSEALAPGYGQALVEALVERRELPAAFAVHRAYARQSVARFGAGFTYRPLDWTVTDNFETGSDFIERPAPHVRFFAEPATGGVFLSRLTALAPGRYRLAANVEAEAGDNGNVAVTVACVAGSEERALTQAQFAVRSGRFAHDFTVAPDCRFQWLRFSVTARGEPVAARLTRVDLARADAL